MDRNTILDAMEQKAAELYDSNLKRGGEYALRGKRGAFTVEIKNGEINGQWDSSLRHFGSSFWEPDMQGTLTINSGCNFESGMRGKVAYTRRTGRNSGVHCYEVLGGETFWPGALKSKDGNCICAFGGLSAEDDVLISRAGIEEYERQLR